MALRIAVVTPSVSRRGGTEKCLSWLIEDLSRRADVTVYAGEIADTDVSRAHVRRLPTIGHPRLLRYLSFLVANWAWFRLRGLVSAPGHDVVLATGGDCSASDVVYAHFCAAAWSAKLERGEVVLPGRGRRRWLRNLHYRIFLRCAAATERVLYRRPAVIAVSRGVQDELAVHYGVEPERVAVVPNAVDERVRLPTSERRRIRDEVRAAHAIPAGTTVLLFVAAGDWKRKGLLEVIEALALLPELPVHLLVVGQDDVEQYRGHAARSAVERRVTFCGFSTTAERYYAAADIFVYPSAYEAFSLVSLEAAGAGLPLVVTRINGTEDLVRDGETGFFVERDPADIAAKVRLLVEDKRLRRRMAASARERSMAFSREHVSGAILEYLEDRRRAQVALAAGSGR